MPRRSLTAGLLLMALASACKPGAVDRPSSRANGLSISGTVTGSTTSGLTVRAASGGVVRMTTTDYAGRFTFADLPRGEYAVTAVPGDTLYFTPASRYVTLFDRDVPGQDFVSAAGNVIYGILSDVSPAGGLGGVAVTFIGPVTITAVTDANGFYRASHLPNGTYAVATAAVSGRYVVPNAILVPVAGGQIVALNFSAFATAGPTHTISGTVTGPVVEGIEIAISDTLGSTYGSTRTDASGHYAFVGLQDPANYLVTATPSPGLMLRSRGRDVALSGSDVTGVDFEEYLPATPRWAYLSALSPTDGSSIYQYAIGFVDGALTPLATPTIATDQGGGRVVADPSGSHLYATNYGTNTITQYAIGDDGQLTAMTPPSVACTTQPQLLTIDPNGGFLWVHNVGSGELRTFPIGAGGALATTPSSTLTVGGGTDLAVHPEGKALYLVTAGAIFQYAVAGDGSLSALSPASVPITGAAGSLVISAMTFDPSGRFALATVMQTQPGPIQTAWLARFTVDGPGRLTQVGTVAAWLAWSPPFDLGPAEVVVDPSGRFVYAGSGVGAYGRGQSVMQFMIGASGSVGALDPATVDAGGSSSFLAVDPSGRFVYLSNTGQGTVSWFPIGADGALGIRGSITTGSSPGARCLPARR